MPYGTIKVDNIIYTKGGVDTTLTVSGIVDSLSGAISVTGAISGASVSAPTGTFTTLSGNTTAGTTATFVTGVFTTSLSGATITGNTGQFSNITGVSGVFTTRISGATITGNTGQFSSITGISGVFTSVSGTTFTVTSGVFASGTAAAPSVSVGTTTNGLYSSATNEVALATNSTSRLVVDASGNVNIDSGTFYVDAVGNRTGVNNTSPGSYNAAADDLVVGLTGDTGVTIASTNQGSIFFADGTTGGAQQAAGYLYYLHSNDSMVLGTANSPRLTITSGGLVGIGTTAPYASLEVQGTQQTHTGVSSQVGPVAAYNTTNNADTAAVRTVLSLMRAGKSGVSYGSQANFNIGRYSQANANANTQLNLRLANGVTNDPDNDVMTWLGDGRVGIGTTSPGYTLDVANSVIQVGTSTDAFVQYKSTAGNWHVGANSSNAYVFYSGTYGSGTERARIDSSGRLLVGTDTDSGGALLQVNGDRIRVATAKTPASATATGTTGEVCWDANYIYVCTATNTWKRAAIATW